MKFDPALFDQRGKRGYWYRTGKVSRSPYVRRDCRGCGQDSLVSPYVRYLGFCSHHCSVLGERNPNWQDDPGYGSTHARVHVRRGKAVSCIWGCAAAKFEWANLTGDYKDPQDYASMCISCHKRYDAARGMMELDVLPRRSRWRQRGDAAMRMKRLRDELRPIETLRPL